MYPTNSWALTLLLCCGKGSCSRLDTLMLLFVINGNNHYEYVLQIDYHLSLNSYLGT